MTKRILAFHAHPDDVEIQAGGTLALLAQRGHSITIATMTPGDCGSADLEPDEIAAVRRREAAAAAALIGAKYVCAELRDLAVFNDDTARRRVVEILRRARPDIILTAPPVDYMADHEQASSIVRDACFGAPVRNYTTGAFNPAPPLDSIPHLYFVTPMENADRDSQPVRQDFLVDISSTMDTKTGMLSCHVSQREWLLKHHGIDNYVLSMQRWSEELGARAGVKYAEGFRSYKGHAYPRTPLLEQLLEGRILPFA
jgi:LmbE family N-acetylglucosaminyl deacetylase